MSSPDRSLTIVFNGEIYGFQDARRQLVAKGHQFRTTTDTEVIVYLYEDMGLEMFTDLKGMFAFAIWDAKRQRLILARDRLGKKPVYYSTYNGKFVFASELHALLADDGIPRDIDLKALDLYLTLGYIPAPYTILRHVNKLEAGHYAIVRGGTFTKRRYWGIDDVHRAAPDWSGAEQQLVDRIRKATSVRMVSDVPLGCFLSGGVDSSVVLSFMAELSSKPVKTFAIGFPEHKYNELPYARSVANYFGADHHEYIVEPNAVHVLDEMVTHFGEPFADSSALPMWYLSQLTKRDVTVALTGDGGDELFGGYYWYLSAKVLELAARVPRRVRLMLAALPRTTSSGLLRTVGNGARLALLPEATRHASQRQIVTASVKEGLYNRDWLNDVRGFGFDWLAGQYSSLHGEDPLNKAMITDLNTYMAEDLLVKVDRSSMAHSLECRSPFLDSDLVEWAASLPAEYKVRTNSLGWPVRNGGKVLLKAAMRGRLPDAVLDRNKQGFSVPLEYWFRGGLKAVIMERLLNGTIQDTKLFRPEGLRWIAEAHFSGRQNYADALWALLVLAIWLETYYVRQ